MVSSIYFRLRHNNYSPTLTPIIYSQTQYSWSLSHVRTLLDSSSWHVLFSAFQSLNGIFQIRPHTLKSIF